MLNENIKGIYLLNKNKKISIGDKYQAEIPIIIRKEDKNIKDYRKISKNTEIKHGRQRRIRNKIRFIKK